MASPTNWTTSSEASSYQVYTGVWTNWSRGSVMGLTLTLNRSNGNLLIAFAASFIGLVSARFWHILCLVFHRYYSTSDPRDALHHQRQALLANSGSSESAIWKFIQLIHAWRQHTRHAFLRALPVLLVAMMCLTGFNIAGGFSSRISTGIGNTVLLDGASCGWLPESLLEQSEEILNSTGNAVMRYYSETVGDAMYYAAQCYSNRTRNVDCGTYVVPRLSSLIGTQASCPFNKIICISNSANLRLDSEYIDSHVHLGLNAPPNQRFLYRNIFHCAPLVTKGYKNQVSDSYMNFTAYYYGPKLMLENNKVAIRTNYTYQAPTSFWQYNLPRMRLKHLSGNYIIEYSTAGVVNGMPDLSHSGFVPVPELTVPDANISLFFLQGNGIAFIEPANDLWYRATVQSDYTVETIGTYKYPTYQPEEDASPLGCTLQYQLCSTGLPKERQCTQPASRRDTYSAAIHLFNASTNGVPDTTRFNIFWNFESLEPYEITSMFGSMALASSETVSYGRQPWLPANQWQLDVIKWWEGRLASLQSGVVRKATGPKYPDMLPLLVRPNSTYEEAQCRSQMLLSTDYVSFSLFGLYFTFVTGILIVLVSFSIEPLLAYLARHQYEPYKVLEWQTGDTLQLQRLNYQRLNMGTWTGGTDGIPVTTTDMIPSLALHQGDFAEVKPVTKNRIKTLLIKVFPYKLVKRTERSTASSRSPAAEHADYSEESDEVPLFQVPSFASSVQRQSET